MKQIIDQCSKLISNPNMNSQNQDFLKLRLRGRGSGFKEGPDKRGIWILFLQYSESDELMHLCVSSKYLEIYNTACEYVEQLLKHLYKEYDDYCRRSKRREPNLKIKRIEAYGTPGGKSNDIEAKPLEKNKENEKYIKFAAIWIKRKFRISLPRYLTV